MKRILAFLLILTSGLASAQDNSCRDRIMAKEGKWVKLTSTIKASAADYAIQRKFSDAVYGMLSSYRPRGLQAEWSGGYSSIMHKQPVARYTNLLLAMKYHCEGTGLALDITTNTTGDFLFNVVGFLEIYDTTTDYHGTGFFELQLGLPVEIRPGVWQFRDAVTSLGMSTEGLTKTWLLTYPGQVPWSYVTRREFLLKRKRNVQKLYAEAKKQTQDAIDFWDNFKKQKEKEFANDATKMANFMTGYYNPGLAEAKAKQPNILKQYEVSLQRIDEQLSAPAQELDKMAIVIKDQSSLLDYNFTDKVEQFAKVLTKPNPAYFKRGLPPAAPQMITVSIDFDPKDPVSAGFAREIEQLIDLGYMQSLIGKSTPPAYTKTSASQAVNNSSPKNQVPNMPALQVSTSPKNNKETTSKPLTPQGPLAKNGIFVTGKLSAPAGVPVTLGCNSNNDLTITIPKAAGNAYNTTDIRFTKPVKENEEYNILLKQIAPNMKGVVYYGKGKAPDDAGKVKIGVDYLYDLLTRSTDDKAMSTFYESFAPAVGGHNGEEGRYVVFISNTKGFGGSDGKFRQVFWRDRNTGVTKMISVTAAGEQGNGDCAEPSISADGKTVVFESRASNLVAGDNNNFKDVFMWRASTNTIELISRATGGGGAEAECFDAMVSGNGNFVVFTSSAGNLASVPKGRSVANIFLRDVAAGKTEMISVDPAQRSGGNGYKASISYDGSRISFCSPTNTLVTNDNNGLWDIFLWEKGKTSLKRVSLTHDGKERNGGTESASRQVASTISGNGRYVAFATTASNMVPNDNNNFQDVFVVDVETGKVTVASFADDGQASNGDSPIEQGERVAISYDGTWVAFPTKATNLGAAGSNIIVHNTISNKKFAAIDVKGSYVGRPSISYNGSYVVFGKSANLDSRFSVSGIFAHFTGNGPCRDCGSSVAQQLREAK